MPKQQPPQRHQVPSSMLPRLLGLAPMLFLQTQRLILLRLRPGRAKLCVSLQGSSAWAHKLKPQSWPCAGWLMWWPVEPRDALSARPMG